MTHCFCLSTPTLAHSLQTQFNPSQVTSAGMVLVWVSASLYPTDRNQKHRNGVWECLNNGVALYFWGHLHRNVPATSTFNAGLVSHHELLRREPQH